MAPKIKITRYEKSNPRVGYSGYIEPEDKAWTLYFHDDGNVVLFKGDSKVVPTDSSPWWATKENAAIASAAVEEAGGSRERAALAYAHTMLGVGEPAAAIDTATMLKRFAAAVEGDGPVLVLVATDVRETLTPLTKHSPLVRLVLLAVDAGVAPERLSFVPAPDVACAYTLGEADLDVSGVLAPRCSFSWCSLSAGFFLAWVGHGGELVVAPDAHPVRSVFDVANADHRSAVKMIAEHLSGDHPAAAEKLMLEL